MSMIIELRDAAMTYQSPDGEVEALFRIAGVRCCGVPSTTTSTAIADSAA